jgi:hypothetical protein
MVDNSITVTVIVPFVVRNKIQIILSNNHLTMDSVKFYVEFSFRQTTLSYIAAVFRSVTVREDGCSEEKP